MTKKMFLIPLALLTLGLTSTTAGASAPDRCRDLGSDGYPEYCDPVGERVAPYWGETACCVDDDCVEAQDDGSCPSGTETYSCEYAELYADGGLTCLYLVPHYCHEHDCPSSDEIELEIAAPPEEDFICCYQEGCLPIHDYCNGMVYYCMDGVSNWDGTVTCFDEDIPW